MSSQAARDEVEDIAAEEVRAALDALALRTVARGFPAGAAARRGPGSARWRRP